MPTAIVMPKLSDDMREGKIISWKKKVGDKVESAEVIAEVETEKANLDVEAYAAGTLVQIVVEAGQSIAVGQPIAYVAEEGEEPAPAPAAKPAPAAAEAAPPTAAAAPKAASVAAHAPEAKHAAAPVPASAPTKADPAAKDVAHDSGTGRVRASPLARKMAADSAVDLRSLQGSGPQGRVVKADIEKALSEAPVKVAHDAAPASVKERSPAPGAAPRAAEAKQPAPRGAPPELKEETIALSGMRRAIARRMAEAKPGSPHFYLTVNIDMGPAMELRKQMNEAMAGEWAAPLSVNDLVLRAAVLAVGRFPAINASFAGENVQRHGKIHLGFALSVEDGLLTPVIRDAQDKTLAQIAKEVRALAERGRARKLRPDEYQGATFTVSNLGMYGVSEFSAIINPGEAGILAVGAVEKRPMVVGDEIKVGQQMTVTLSIDHRVGDGAIGAQFLRELKQVLEQPLRLLA
jgi:pyruvate dehydrogenase E2 component (dihydrolipoamide acetyltransferase)